MKVLTFASFAGSNVPNRWNPVRTLPLEPLEPLEPFGTSYLTAKQ